MEKDKTPRVKLLVLNDFLTFDRKLYQLLGINFGRPIKIKAILYFALVSGIELIIYFTPVIGSLISWIPFIYLLAVPICIAYLLSDVKTEGRNSLAFFRSIFLYQMRKRRKVTYERGREVAKPRNYRFQGITTMTFYEDKLHNKQALEILASEKDALKEKKSKGNLKGKSRVHITQKTKVTGVTQKQAEVSNGGVNTNERRYLRLPYSSH